MSSVPVVGTASPPGAAPAAGQDLDAAISSILGEPSDDLLESPNFDPIEAINAAFPTEQSLAGLDKVLVRLRKQTRRIDEEIRELMRTQTEAGLAAVEELKEVKASVETLHARIRRIKERAGQAEGMVQEITKDIKSLDFAKRNLTTSITVLRRLQMLVSAVGQLQFVAGRRQYRETASLLQAILQLLAHFKSYRSIPFVSTLFSTVDSVQADLRRRILDEFEGAFASASTLRASISILNEACHLAEVIERDNPKRQIVDWYCDLQLTEYRSIFRGNDEVAALDNTSRRYSWLRRQLKLHDEEHAGIFPANWKVPEILCEKFTDDTRKDLGDVLAKDNAQGRLDVKLMLQTLQQTIDFENKLDRRFAGKDMDRASLDRDRGRLSEEQGRRSEEAGPSKFNRRISAAFEPYLEHYIAAEDRNLADMLNVYRAKGIAEDDSTMSVLSSSTDLFYFYRQTLVHCSKMSTGTPFLNLAKVFAKYLRLYAELLQGKLPSGALNEKAAHEVCLILNTAEYCHTTIPQLQDKIREKIDPSLVEKVDFSNEEEVFLSVANAALLALVRGVESALEPAWNIMTRLPWNTMTNTGDQSEYVYLLAREVHNVVPVIKKTVAASKFFKSFCDKLAESVFAKFYANIFRCRLISEVGAEQMLLDVNAISTVFASLPKTDDGTVPAAYAKILAKGVSKCECFLKVLMSPVEPYEALVETYLLLAGNDANAGVFTRILDLKGVPRPNQAAAIDVFNRRAVGLKGGTETQLQPPAPTPVATTAPLNRPTAPSPAPSLSAASAANAAAVLQGALSSSVSTAAQLATAAGKSQTVTSLSTGLKNWMTMTRASTPRDGTPISGGSGSPGTPGGSAGAQASSAFAKMAALGQNLLSSAKGQPPPPPPKS